MKRPLAYITAPWSENEFENTENAAKYCRAVYDAGFSPVCPTLFLPLFLCDEIPQEHKDGIDMAREYLRRAAAAVMRCPAPCRKPRIITAAIPKQTKKAAATRCV